MKHLFAALLVSVCAVSTGAAAQDAVHARWIDPSGAFSLDLASNGWMAVEGGNIPNLVGIRSPFFLPTDFAGSDRMRACGVREMSFPNAQRANQRQINAWFGRFDARSSEIRDGVRVFAWINQGDRFREYVRAFVLVTPAGDANYLQVTCVGDPSLTSQDVAQFEAILNSLHFGDRTQGHP